MKNTIIDTSMFEDMGYGVELGLDYSDILNDMSSQKPQYNIDDLDSLDYDNESCELQTLFKNTND